MAKTPALEARPKRRDADQANQADTRGVERHVRLAPCPRRLAGRRHSRREKARGSTHERGRPARRKPSEAALYDRQGRGAPCFLPRGPRLYRSCPRRALWVADTTYVPTQEGYLYLAVVIDAYSRKVVGWEMAGHLRSERVLEALDMAIEQRDSEETVHHSDQGCRYTAIAFGERCTAEGVRPSMGSVGDCYDNALCESFFATFECELIERDTFASRSEARLSVFEFIEGCYNPDRLHSGIGYQSPNGYEEEDHARDHSHSEDPHSPVAA